MGFVTQSDSLSLLLLNSKAKWIPACQTQQQCKCVCQQSYPSLKPDPTGPATAFHKKDTLPLDSRHQFVVMCFCQQAAVEQSKLCDTKLLFGAGRQDSRRMRMQRMTRLREVDTPQPTLCLTPMARSPASSQASNKQQLYYCWLLGLVARQNA